jgi:hypothetical protein
VWYFTFLRDPVDRYLAHLNYQVARMDIPWTLERFLNEPRFDDFMVRRLAGRPDLDGALRVLETKLSFVGLVERFDESLVLLRQHLPWTTLDITYERRNVADVAAQPFRWEDLSCETKERIVEKNRLDRELYKRAEALFLAQERAFPGDLMAQLESFRERNKGAHYGAPHVVAAKLRRAWFHYFVEWPLRAISAG